MRTIPVQVTRLLLSACMCVAVARVGTLLVSVKRTRALLIIVARCGRVSASPTDLARAVHIASRVTPGAACLTQALALQALLARAGHGAHVQIGVANDPTFDAHAWVECEGAVLLGGPQVDRYTRIAAFDASL